MVLFVVQLRLKQSCDVGGLFGRQLGFDDVNQLLEDLELGFFGHLLHSGYQVTIDNLDGRLGQWLIIKLLELLVRLGGLTKVLLERSTKLLDRLVWSHFLGGGWLLNSLSSGFTLLLDELSELIVDLLLFLSMLLLVLLDLVSILLHARALLVRLLGTHIRLRHQDTDS